MSQPPQNGQPQALPEPLPLSIQGALTPMGLDGKVYVVMNISDPHGSMLFQVRMTAQNAEGLAPNIGKMFAELAKEAKRVMAQGGLMVAQSALIVPGHPAFRPPTNGPRSGQ